MREILFRGKSERNGEFVYGYYWTNLFENHFIRRVIDEKGFYTVEDVEIDSKTIGQYTGLKDKHGKKIFEGDVVKQTVDYGSGDKNIIIGVVKEDDVNPCFVIENKSDTEYDFIKCFCAELEVIGNIYDNPEFLE